ncbi:MAG TPA: GTPase [Rhodospirillaceae bacterium]|jgi:flagellar biosynthesis protein FlhF|nr:GTPase [Alphaproteobacteria bacterium]HBH26014.1 GTPase [Rhodospirillaceae bacterium]
MRLKSFSAPTLKEAMQIVRDELGPEAVILSTRGHRGGGVCLTAAVDEMADDGGASWLQYDEESAESSPAEVVTDALLFHAVPEDIADEVIACVAASGHVEPAPALAEALAHLFTFGRMPSGASGRPVVLVGPPGAGKTAAVARLATEAAMVGAKVALICADAERAGAAAQIQAFAKILGAPLFLAKGPPQAAAFIAQARSEGAQRILVDSAGANPLDARAMRATAALAKAAQGDVVLALPAGLNAEEAGEASRIFAAAGARFLLATRLDAARRFGALLAGARKGCMAFAATSATPSVAQGPVPVTARSLAHALLHGLEPQQGAQPQQRDAIREGAA